MFVILWEGNEREAIEKQGNYSGESSEKNCRNAQKERRKFGETSEKQKSVSNPLTLGQKESMIIISSSYRAEDSAFGIDFPTQNE